MIVEVCAAGLESARIAERAGADRIELCTALGIGGITPSTGLFERVKSSVSLPIHVLIRPRGGDFTYSEAEMEVIQADIAHFKALGADGIVCGVLKKDHTLDVGRTAKLLEWSQGLSFTFHRAFDWIPEPLPAFQKLQELGVNTVLSSGQCDNARAGLPLLNEMQATATTITVMPGAGINPGNALQFKNAGFKALHLSATSMQPNSDQAPRISFMGSQLLSETHVPITNYEKLHAVVQSVKE